MSDGYVHEGLVQAISASFQARRPSRRAFVRYVRVDTDHAGNTVVK